MRDAASARSVPRRPNAAATPSSFGEGFSAELQESLQALSAGEREVVALRIVLDLDSEETARLARDFRDRRLDQAESRAFEARREDERP